MDRYMIKFLKDKSLSIETHVDKCTTTDLSTIRPDSAPFWALRASEALAMALRARCVGATPQLPSHTATQIRGAVSQTDLKRIGAPRALRARHGEKGAVRVEPYTSSVDRSGRPRLNMRSNHERVDSLSIVLFAASSWRCSRSI